MKRFLTGAALVALLAVMPAPALAQEAGVKGGVNFASLTRFDEEADSTSRRLGLIGGVWVRVASRGALSFQLEALLSEKGIKFEQAFDGVPVEGNLRIRYVEVPFLARFDAAPGGAARFYLLAGAAPAFRLGDGRLKLKAEGEEETIDFGDTGEDLKSFDLGLVGAAGIEFGRALVEGRYTHGLLVAGDGDDSPKNRVFSVMVGFRFR
jgi:hypothetical protein